MELKIQKWGNSAGIRLSSHVLGELGVRLGDSLEGEVSGGKLVLQAARHSVSSNAAVAAMKYAIQPGTDEGMAFLQCWLCGDFEAIRKEWPDAPESIFIGADPLHSKG